MRKRFHLTYIAMLVCIMASAHTFSHYVGHAGSALNQHGMQSTAEIHYYYYVDANGSQITLQLPCENYTKNGSDNEPRNYFRWYDYATDRASSRLGAVGSKLQPVSDAQGNARGLFALNLYSNGNANPCHSTVGVTYTPPAGAANSSWEGDIIACDVSRYCDWGGHGGTEMTAEPTLSARYIFHILPGRQLAENITNSSSADLRSQSADLTIEDNRRIVFGARSTASYITLRTEMPADRYYFYPLKQTNHHIYSADNAHLITSADYDRSTLYHSTGILWRVYDKTKTKYTDMYSLGSQMHYFGMAIMMNNGNGWKTLDGASTTKPTIDYGDMVYVVAYARSGKGGPYAPVANFELLFQNTYPKSRTQINASGDNERTIDYLESHYQQAMKPISFDDDNDDMDLSAPTTPENNASAKPSPWNRRTYGFAYYELKDFAPSSGWWMPFTPVHGEYGLYKSANLSGVSTTAQQYRWWPSGPTVYDRTYERTGGKQYGHFLYIDASDESRQIAAADFKANLCSGAKLIFSGAIANYTTGSTQPQVMFRLYGIITDDDGNITDQRLITSFSSGDFATNTDSHSVGTWMQIYSKLVLPRNSGAENYSDFRIVMDNMCMNTNGADYLIDDLRLYIQPAKVDVVQNTPLCPDQNGYKSVPKNIMLKLRANYENMLAMVGNQPSSVFYRICDEQGRPVSNIDYDGDGKPDAYGRAEIPAEYDANKMLPTWAADGSTTTHMFERDAQNDLLILMANRNFDLEQGKNYYVSVAYPDDYDSTQPGTWGVPSNVCSTYSDMFQIVQQNVLITDANGSVVTTIRVSCDDNRTPNVNITGRLETADIVNGGKITLNNVRFDWFLSKPNEENTFAQIDGLQEALARYRASQPTATELVSWYQHTDAEGYALLKKYVDNGQLIIAASNDLAGHRFGQGMMGVYKIAAIPIATSITEGKTTYEICPDPMYFALRIVEDGPKLTLGFADVTYPTDNRAVRIGLPQIRTLAAKGKPLVLPVTSVESAQRIEFENNSDVFISGTNDPTFDNTRQIVGHISNNGMQTGDSQLSVVFNTNATETMHEGYWYELNFSYRQERVGTEAVVSCPGETFITFRVVPEYITWNSSQDNRLNANWNNDRNWLRSTAAELYKSEYTDYGTPTLGTNPAIAAAARTSAYTPMKFSKVTVPDQTGRVYPDLGNIVYRTTNQIATKLTNAKGEEATQNIAYDLMVRWNYDTDDHSDTGDGTFSCEKFQGNVCDEIYFKPHAELLDPCYLVYRRAYAEKELATNRWYIASSPLRATYAGDMYAPAASGRQQTEAFSPITFDPSIYSRTLRPFYQRAWDSHAQQTADNLTFYDGYGYNDSNFRIDTISDASLNIESLYWSHVYNKVDEPYADGQGFSIRAGDRYYPQDGQETWLVRLPKADTQYSYYAADGTVSGVSAAVDKTMAGRMIVDPSTEEKAYSTVRQPLRQGVHSADRYYLVGNPYTASLSAYQFIKGNPAFDTKIWTLEAGLMEAHILPDDAGTSERYKDVTIEPMQAFFVKLKDGLTAPDYAYFTTAMTVDRWVTGGSSVQQQAATLSITATDGDNRSTARVVIDAQATPDFDNAEDVELLQNADLDNIPQAYTVAGSEAAALNTTTGIDWLPMGIASDHPKAVSVTFGTNRKLAGHLYLFDAQTRHFTPISGGQTVTMQAGQHGRYYITRHSSMPADGPATSLVKCYAPGGGRITVSSIAADIDNIEVYDTSGVRIVAAQCRQSAEKTLSVAQPGIYIVRTRTNGTTHTFKVDVK